MLKKIFLISSVFIIILGFFDSCKKISKDFEKEYVGTYKITDAINNIWILELKEDNSLNLQKEGENRNYYGTWYYDINYKKFLMNTTNTPDIIFPNPHVYLYNPAELDFNNEYLYYSFGVSSSKDPETRINLVKID